MPSEVAAQWRDKANGFFSLSGVKLKKAGQSAGTLVGDVAKDVKSRWAVLQQARQQQQQQQPSPPGESIQDRLLSAASSTGLLFRKGLAETKDKVVVGKIKVEEAAKKTADKSKIILNNIERWQKGVARGDVFGIPIEVTVQRQQSTRLIPQILVRCAENLILSGLNAEYLFKAEGDRKVIQQLISLYNQDWNASLPEGISPTDLAELVKCYLASLPEPLTTFDLYREIKDERSSIHGLRNILKKLPTVNYMTLEYVTALLVRVSQKSLLNKMDAHSLSLELAPLIMWQKDDSRVAFRNYLNNPSKGPQTVDSVSNNNAWADYLDDDDNADAASQIPLDDGPPQPDYGAIEVIQCLIEHHNAVFTDANVTVWR